MRRPVPLRGGQAPDGARPWVGSMDPAGGTAGGQPLMGSPVQAPPDPAAAPRDAPMPSGRRVPGPRLGRRKAPIAGAVGRAADAQGRPRARTGWTGKGRVARALRAGGASVAAPGEARERWAAPSSHARTLALLPSAARRPRRSDAGTGWPRENRTTLPAALPPGRGTIVALARLHKADRRTGGDPVCQAAVHSPAGRSARRSKRVTVVPTPGSLAMRRSPPKAWTKSSTMVRPRPVPRPAALVV